MSNPGRTNLELWLEFNDDVNDSHGSNNLTASGSPSYATGKQGNGIDFEAGSSQYASIADNASLSLGSDTDFWMGFWWKPESIGAEQALVFKGTSGLSTNKEYHIRMLGAGTIQFLGSDGSSTWSKTHSTTLSTGTWYYIEVKHDKTSNVVGVAINNGSFETVGYSAGTQDLAGTFYIGSELGTGSYADGAIDEFAFFKDRLPTSDERAWLYNSGSGRTYSETAPVNPTADDMEAHWSLDETSGTRADSHGSNDLTDNNTVGSATGIRGKAGDFEASNSEYLSIADNASLSITGALTLGAWVNLESAGSDKEIITKNSSTPGQFGYRLEYDNGVAGFRFFVSSDGSTTSIVTASTFGTPSLATWYFVVATHDPVANTIGISVNAGNVDTTTHSTNIFDNTSAFMLGSQDGLGKYMDGLIDEAFVFGKVLSQAEIEWLYNSGSGRTYNEISGISESGASPIFF